MSRASTQASAASGGPAEDGVGVCCGRGGLLGLRLCAAGPGAGSGCGLLRHGARPVDVLGVHAGGAAANTLAALAGRRLERAAALQAVLRGQPRAAAPPRPPKRHPRQARLVPAPEAIPRVRRRLIRTSGPVRSWGQQPWE